MEDKIKSDNNIDIFENNQEDKKDKNNINVDNNSNNFIINNESIEKKSDNKKDDIIFNPVNIDDDDGVDDFDNLEEFVI